MLGILFILSIIILLIGLFTDSIALSLIGVIIFIPILIYAALQDSHNQNLLEKQQKILEEKCYSTCYPYTVKACTEEYLICANSDNVHWFKNDK